MGLYKDFTEGVPATCLYQVLCVLLVASFLFDICYFGFSTTSVSRKLGLTAEDHESVVFISFRPSTFRLWY